jgi:VIT1/CCC1 family predicted Fe2+/Mn2+ transporter
MEISRSGEDNNERPWVQYLLAAFVGLVPLALSITLRNSALIGPLSSIIFMMTAGIIFTGLGLYSSAKDANKGLGMFSLVAGAALVGISELSLL